MDNTIESIVIEKTFSSEDGTSGKNLETKKTPIDGGKKNTHFKSMIVEPNTFEDNEHFYPNILNMRLHPTVAQFLSLSRKQIALRYCWRKPTVDYEALLNLISTPSKHFKWAGSDLMHVKDFHGNSELTLIETNSCPSGQKSAPPIDMSDTQKTYRMLIERGLWPSLVEKEKNGTAVVGGVLAVIYDKNPMETSAYASALADVSGEKVYFVPYVDSSVVKDVEPNVRFVKANDGSGEYILEIKNIDYNNSIASTDDNEEWLPVRAAFRYVTQKPWKRIPIHTKTVIFNPIIACLAGGRNKITAAYAYDKFNEKHADVGLKMSYPMTKINVAYSDLRESVEDMGYKCVIKIPYSNAGQGVFVINSKKDMTKFEAKISELEMDFKNCKFLLQALLGHSLTADDDPAMRVHVGTIPDKKGEKYVFDLRMMVSSGTCGLKPLLVYARKAHTPLPIKLPTEDDDDNDDDEYASGHDYYVTNLSVLEHPGTFSSDVSRLVPAAEHCFDALGIGIDLLIEGYIQTCMAVHAIDELASELLETSTDGFIDVTSNLSMINNDINLLREIKEATSSII